MIFVNISFAANKTFYLILFFILAFNATYNPVDVSGGDDDAMNEEFTRYTSSFYSLSPIVFRFVFFFCLSTLCSWIIYFVNKFCISSNRYIWCMWRWTLITMNDYDEWCVHNRHTESLLDSSTSSARTFLIQIATIAHSITQSRILKRNTTTHSHLTRTSTNTNTNQCGYACHSSW